MSKKEVKTVKRDRKAILGPEMAKMLESCNCADNGLDGFVYLSNLISPQVAIWFNDEWAMDDQRFRAVEIEKIQSSVGGLFKIEFLLIVQDNHDCYPIPHVGFFRFYKDGLFYDAQPEFEDDETHLKIYRGTSEEIADLISDVETTN